MIVDEILGTFKKRPKKAPRSKNFSGNILKYENIHKNGHFGLCVMSEWGGCMVGLSSSRTIRDT